jgi:hypothetical protein
MAEPTVNGLLISAVTALSGIVTYLWKQHSDHYKELKADRDECISDREKLWKAMYSIHPASKEISEL